MIRRDLRDMLTGAREEAGLTQAELAAACKVSGQQVSRWERGTAVPGAKVLPRLAAALGIPEGPLYQAAITASQQESKQVRRDANQLADQFREAYSAIHQAHIVMTERIEFIAAQLAELATALEEVRSAVHKRR